jgi:hypothetical protein
MNRTHLYVLTLLAATSLSGVPALAQEQLRAPGTVAVMDTMNRDRSLKNHWWVSGKVTDDRGRPDPGRGG